MKRILRRTPTDEYRRAQHKLTTRVQSRMGWHTVGEAGVYLSSADGYGTFFPNRGGCISRIPEAHVELIAPKRRVKIFHPPKFGGANARTCPPVGTVKRLRRVIRLSRG